MPTLQIGFNEAALCRMRKAQLPHMPMQLGSASMRPHSVECGKQFWGSLECSNLRCFNEAALCRMRKASRSKARSRSLSCFNEAALCRMRKVRPHPHTPPNPPPCFNEAALCRMRKAAMVTPRYHLIDLASMRPHSVECGKVLMQGCDCKPY